GFPGVFKGLRDFPLPPRPPGMGIIEEHHSFSRHFRRSAVRKLRKVQSATQPPPKLIVATMLGSRIRGTRPGVEHRPLAVPGEMYPTAPVGRREPGRWQ